MRKSFRPKSDVDVRGIGIDAEGFEISILEQYLLPMSQPCSLWEHLLPDIQQIAPEIGQLFRGHRAVFVAE